MAYRYDVTRLKCQHSGFTLVLTFQTRDAISEYRQLYTVRYILQFLLTFTSAMQIDLHDVEIIHLLCVQIFRKIYK